ncbi:hypothetical protein [Marinitenerispora sediminis]|uniref:Uncharacterized protein n=1 Tax=Marinitenerispora sediminis TaxID=1931232 RepID=A0A368TEF7_9ACTN|nr:hypothetical protein [Marinitenerispora sediminis]RCV54402.1 hypothetical protein DEF28_08320 [Marinitenerispora sediminis]RCV61131.1 hypothetical protein DEF23_03145 [Marinitenerispora sediminis]RCV62407.1 hypothetical protein DEF24_01405 [Marinitenerispora sediminis]
MTAAVALLAADAQIARDTVTPGVLGFLACAFVGFSLYFLMKNMRKQMARIDFDEGPAEARAERPAAEASAAGSAAPEAESRPSSDGGDRGAA